MPPPVPLFLRARVRTFVCSVLLVAVIAASTAVVAAPRASVQTAPAGASTAPAAPPVGDPATPPPVRDPRLSDALDTVGVSSPAYDRAQAAYAATWRAVVDATTRGAQAQTDLTELGAAQARVAADDAVAVRLHDKAAARAAAHRRSLRTLAVALYVRGGAPGGPTAGLDPDTAADDQAAQSLVDSVGGTAIADLVVDDAIVTSSAARHAADTASLADLGARQAAATERLTRAHADERTDRATLARQATVVADTRMTARVDGADLPLVVLDAYWRAAAAMAVTRPACHLAWSGVAGVGRIESGHGSFRGDTVGADGQEAHPIIGIALDGTHATQVVNDTDHGTLDGDTRYDRAVGPMQVLPSTWRRYGADGNHDGRADPQNYYDAALAAAALLCRVSGLDTDAGLRRTYFAYNPSNAYVDDVLGWTHRYQQVTW